MSDEPIGQRWDWGLLWRGVKPQLIILAFVTLMFAVLVWLTVTQAARE